MATIDDLAAGIDRLNATMDAIAKAEQDERNERKKQSGAAASLARRKFGTPWVRIKSGARDILQGRFRKGGRKIKEGLSQWAKKKGLNTTGGRLAFAAGGMMAFSKAVSHATDRLMEAARRYSEVSASMAAITAQRDLREIMRNMEKGERISGSANTLMQAEQSRKDKQVNIEVVMEKISNLTMAGANRALEFLLAPLDRLAQSIDELIEKLPGPRRQQEPATLGD